MDTVKRAGTWFFGLFLMLHGFAHTPAILDAWKLKTFEDVSHQPNVLLTGAGDTAVAFLGILWLVAAAAFIVTGIGIILHVDWWPPIASLATCASLMMTILWRDDAVIGLAINVALVAVFIGVFIWSLWGPATPALPGRRTPTPA